MIIVLFSLLINNLSLANNVEHLYQDLNNDDRRSFEFVVRTCHVDINSLATIVETTRNDSLDYFKYLFGSGEANIPGRENLFTRRGIGKSVDQLLNSRGYYVGLAYCFPTNTNRRHLYTANLLMFDAFGKVATLSILGTGGASIYRGLSIAGKKFAVAPTVSLFRKLKASEETLTKIPVLMGKSGVYLFNGLSLGLLTYHVYNARKERELMQQIYSPLDVESARSNFESNFELYQQTLLLRKSATTAEEIEKAEELIEKQRENAQYYLLEMLNHQGLDPEERKNLMALKNSLESGV